MSGSFALDENPISTEWESALYCRLRTWSSVGSDKGCRTTGEDAITIMIPGLVG